MTVWRLNFEGSFDFVAGSMACMMLVGIVIGKALAQHVVVDM
jgi:hypothetical protein